MSDYRAFLIDANGHVVKRHDFEAADDTQAMTAAELYIDGHDIEIWQLDRIVGKLPRTT